MKLHVLCLVIGLLFCSPVAASATSAAHRLYQPDSAHWVCDYFLTTLQIPGQLTRPLLSSTEVEFLMQATTIPDNAEAHFSLGRFVRFGEHWRGPFIISVPDDYIDKFHLLENVVSDDAPAVPRWRGGISPSPVCQSDLAADPSSIMMTGSTRDDGDIVLIGLWPRRRVAVEWPLYTSVTTTGDTLATGLLASDHELVMKLLGVDNYEMFVTIEQHRYDRRSNRWSVPRMIGPMSKQDFDRRRVHPASPEIVPRRLPMPYNAPYPVTLQE